MSMIPGFMFGGIGWRLPAILIAVLVAIAAIVWHINHHAAIRREEAARSFVRGQESERAMWVASVDKERQRQRQANDAALQEARARIAALEAERTDLAQALEDLNHAADMAAGADRECIDPGVLRRLDSIR